MGLRFLISLGFSRPGGDITEVLRKVLVLDVLGDDESVLRVLISAVFMGLASPVAVLVLVVDCELLLGLGPGHEALPDHEAERLLLRLVLARILSRLVLTLIGVDRTSVGGTFIAAFRES